MSRLAALLAALLAAPGCVGLVPRAPPPNCAPAAGALAAPLTVIESQEAPARYYVSLGREHGVRPGDRFRVLRPAPAPARRGGGRAAPAALGEVFLPVGEARVSGVLPGGSWLIPQAGCLLREGDLAVYAGGPRALAPPATAPPQG